MPSNASSTRRAGVNAPLIGLAVFACYNANGREIGSYDSQPAKYTTVQLVAPHRSFRLDTIVGRQPVLRERIGFAIARFSLGFVRFFSIIFGGFNKQDEAYISAMLNMGAYTFAAIAAANFIDYRLEKLCYFKTKS